ncbi:paREP10 [Pyrobaculum oguniense TE7]|uniref:PaREP10 n=2 Tax=Pyrobaculum TaxID=2276 RepID=H6Q634_PYROT|nr:paREP10 [Pyrobaculum oguniense TE7]
MYLSGGCYLLVATEDFLNWMYCIHMASVGEVLGIHVHMLRRYGVSPDEAVEAAVAKLQPTAPHIARLLLELASLH